MSTKFNKGVPGVPLAALNAIEDQNTRTVLQAIVDGWHVRNGATGTGESQFVTKGELGAVGGYRLIGGLQGSWTVPGQGQAGPTGAQIGKIINDLQSSVMESPLWKELGSRIRLIDVRTDANILDLNNQIAAANQQILGIKDGSTDIQVVGTDGKGESLRAIKTTVGNSVVAIGEINNISATSTSAAARSIFGLVASVAGNTASINAINDIRVDSNSAAARYIFGVKAQLDQVVSDATAAFINEAQARVNADNAIVRAVETMWSAIGDSEALIQVGGTGLTNRLGATAQQWTQVQAALRDPSDPSKYLSTSAIYQIFDTAVSADGVVGAKYALKVDVNGYVSGFGLMAYANNSTPTSDFIVRADRFAIGSPSGPGITPTVPFIVLTTTDVKGNPPGVYIENAMIKRAAVGTLTVDGNAITAMSVGLGGSGTIGAGGSATLASVTINVPDGCSGVVLNACVTMSGNGSNATAAISITGGGGVSGGTVSASLIDGFQITTAVTGFDASTTGGTRTYYLSVASTAGGAGPIGAIDFHSPGLTAIGGKR